MALPVRKQVGQRQADQVAEQSRTQLDVDTAGGVSEYVAAQAAQGGLEQHDAEQADGDHVKGAQPPVHQHLVHHHLEEQRGEQREDLQHEGHQQHFAEQLAVLDDGWDEPGEVELGQFAGQRGFGAEQDQLASPAGFKLREAQHLGSLALRVMDQRLAIVDARDDEEAPVDRGGNGREWGVGEALGLAARRFGLQTQLLGRQQQFGPAERAAILGELMDELFRRGRQIVKAGEHDQAGQAGIERRRVGVHFLCAHVASVP